MSTAQGLEGQPPELMADPAGAEGGQTGAARATMSKQMSSDSWLEAAGVAGGKVPTASPAQRVLGAVEGLATMPCQLRRFLAMLYSKFGMYTVTAALQYGVNQGLAMQIGQMARRVFFADTLRLDGATAGRLSAASMVPWSIKPLFGMLSDAVPIFGYHRAPYMAIAGACGVLAWTGLGTLPLSGVGCVPLLILVHISVAMPDVMIDARTAELSKAEPRHASDLQSLSWGSLAFAGLLAGLTSGLMVDTLGPRPVFLLLNLSAFGVLVPGLLRWLGEKRRPPGQRMPDLAWLRQHSRVTLLAVYMSVTAVVLSVLQMSVESELVRGLATVGCALVLVIGLFVALRGVSMTLAKVAIFIFAREALQPSLGEAWFQWLKNAPDGPHFSPTVMSWIDCFGSLGLLFGITIYNKFLSNVPYRRIFTYAQFALVFSNLFDYVLVKRWNLVLGIPDVVFLIGDEAITTAMRRFFSMPMFVLAAKVCPDNIEATLFAMLMALANFGGSVGEFVGVTILEAFGVDSDFNNLPSAVLSKSFCRLLPIALIPLLIPDVRASDPVPGVQGPGPGEESSGGDGQDDESGLLPSSSGESGSTTAPTSDEGGSGP